MPARLKKTFGLILCLLPWPVLADAQQELTPLQIGYAAEDIEALPDQRFLLLSRFGGLDGAPGALALLDAETLRAELLTPDPGGDGAAQWGDADCPGPVGDALSPHGIHLSRRGGGSLQLLVVNHGGRESVELFEVTRQEESYRLHWRGCVAAPVASLFNDVAALPDGGFVVTHMFDPRDSTAMQRGAAGEATGFVWRWSPDTGFRRVGGSEGGLPNGIQVTADGKTAFVAYSGGEIRKLDLEQGRQLGSIAVRQPDNLSWTRTGQLLQTSLLQAVDFEACASLESGFCDVRFAIWLIDPETLDRRKLLEHAGPPFGAPTVATEMGPWIYLGSFAGDRIARFPSPSGNR